MRTSSSVSGDHVLGDILSWFLWKAGTKGVMGRGEKARTLRSFPSPPSRASHLSPALARSPLSLGKPVEETVTLLHEYIKYVPAHFYNITPGVFCHPSSDCLHKKNSQISYSRSSQKRLHGKTVEGGRRRELDPNGRSHLPELFITKLSHSSNEVSQR